MSKLDTFFTIKSPEPDSVIRMSTRRNKPVDRGQLDSDLNDVVEAMWALKSKGALTEDEQERLKHLNARHNEIVDALGE